MESPIHQSMGVCLAYWVQHASTIHMHHVVSHESLCCFQVGDEVTKDEPITTNPNVGGFGQDRIRSLGVGAWGSPGIQLKPLQPCPCANPRGLRIEICWGLLLVTPLKTNELIPTIAIVFFCLKEVTFCNPIFWVVSILVFGGCTPFESP